ncbi:MAG: prepilin peptidase, partial [Xanthobacteraceae bacterium]
MMMEAVQLTLFPAMMAFAASSDLLTMTIANRVSLILVVGFVLLALLAGMSGADVLSHFGAGAAVLVVAFGCFACGWIGGG